MVVNGEQPSAGEASLTGTSRIGSHTCGPVAAAMTSSKVEGCKHVSEEVTARETAICTERHCYRRIPPLCHHMPSCLEHMRELREGSAYGWMGWVGNTSIPVSKLTKIRWNRVKRVFKPLHENRGLFGPALVCGHRRICRHLARTIEAACAARSKLPVVDLLAVASDRSEASIALAAPSRPRGARAPVELGRERGLPTRAFRHLLFGRLAVLFVAAVSTIFFAVTLVAALDAIAPVDAGELRVCVAHFAGALAGVAHVGEPEERRGPVVKRAPQAAVPSLAAPYRPRWALGRRRGGGGEEEVVHADPTSPGYLRVR